MEATRRKRAEPHEHTRMQVRLDLPTPISYAPDQTEMHNALRRLFVAVSYTHLTLPTILLV